jgi:hypothetical protein
MSPTTIAAWRLLGQRIGAARFEKPEDVVRWMGALQAQDYGQALWAVGLRMRTATVVDIEQAIADRTIIRTWPMRGTIHFVPAEDAKWMLQLGAARRLATDGHRMAQLELDAAIMGRCGQLCYDALHSGRQLSRPELLQLLEQAGISTSGQRGYHILWYLAQSGLICLGPMQGKQQTFVLLDEWAPHARELPRAEALAELARRYFASHAPATLHDFAWWSGLTVGDARAGLEAAKPGLIAEKLNEVEYWMPSVALGETPDPSGVHLLPSFDEYLLGYRDRSAVLAAEHAQKVVPGSNGMFQPIIVVDGQVVGIWKRVVKKSAVAITFHPFAQFDSADERVTAASERYSAFLGLPLA